ncbi:SDR family oxidoreductase [Peribacillus muralis]|uniref:NAD(P)-dependent oxidoreductase n=1 Tax=Peribacillus muralis TaxID=264697 RepID=UPI001F4DAA0A|nr:NAD(P)-binding oxidoreductase [Peribacillus muralis]MCK1994997.1 SDR family oxidoreductase [Peribacillus muralis]MCK2015632.1 SDR family oxidoreductase [Peribacillus muralis]
MNLFIVGATGKTGQIVTRMALHKGHRVTAFVRSPQKLNPHDNLTVVSGNVTSAKEMIKHMGGHDAVICCLGTEGTGPTNFLTDSAKALTAAMEATGINRIGYIASAGIHQEIDGIFGKLITYMLRHVLKDHGNAVKIFKDEELNYTVARPMGLTDKPGRGVWRVAAEGLPPKPSRSIAREDVATFLLEAIEKNQYERQSIAIAY